MSRQAGITLVSVLFLLIAVLVLTATLFLAVFIDVQAASNVSAGDDALYVAEAGIHHLWSILEPEPDFGRELAWPDGEPPFGSPVGFPEPPRTYRVRVEALPDGTLGAFSEGTSHRGTRRNVHAIFRREPGFRPPASLTVSAGTTVSDASGSFEASSNESETARPAVAAEDRAAAEALAAVTRGDPPIALVAGSGLREAGDRLQAASGLSVDTPPDGASFGTADDPVLVRFVGAAEIVGSASVVGIALADRPLRVRGRLEIDGLLLAPHGIDVEGELVVRGAAWVAGDVRLADGGRLIVEYSSAALDRADEVGGAALPKAALLGAWREVW